MGMGVVLAVASCPLLRIVLEGPQLVCYGKGGSLHSAHLCPEPQEVGGPTCWGGTGWDSKPPLFPLDPNLSFSFY